MFKKILTESERLQRNARMRKRYAERKGKGKTPRVSQYPFERHQWKRIESRLSHLFEEYSWWEVEQVLEKFKPQEPKVKDLNEDSTRSF